MLITINIYIQLYIVINGGNNMKALIDLPIEINQTLNIIKAQHNLKNKAEAITLVVQKYSDDNLEPELRPDFVKKILANENKITYKFKDMDEFDKIVKKHGKR